jgi:hypothetical protein
VIVFPSLIYGQKITLLTALADSIKETSGLIYFDQKLITHNDSDGRPALYEIDSISGNVIRSVAVSNATNTHWEDICYDSTYLYIGDFGNDGSRTDLSPNPFSTNFDAEALISYGDSPCIFSQKTGVINGLIFMLYKWS